MEADECLPEKSVSKSNAEYLWKIGNMLSNSCDVASRIYMCSLERYLAQDSSLLKIGSKHAHFFCKHCGSLFKNSNSSLRIQPIPSLNSHLKKLLKMESENPWKLNNRQKRKLKKLRETTNTIVYTCFVCKKKTVFPGDKKHNYQYRSVRSSVPLSKIKLKKGDLNAGLFIPSPSCRKEEKRNTPVKDTSSETPLKNEKINLNSSEISTPLGTSVTSFNDSYIKKKENSFSWQMNLSSAKVRTPNSAAKSEYGKQSSNKKKRKSLFDEISELEQKTKKKTSLSSFLLSL